jgi:hypothetical protein
MQASFDELIVNISRAARTGRRAKKQTKNENFFDRISSVHGADPHRKINAFCGIVGVPTSIMNFLKVCCWYLQGLQTYMGIQYWPFTRQK